MYLKLALSNVAKSVKDFAVYFITLVIGVSVFYAFNSVEEQSLVLDMSEAQGAAMDILNMLIPMVSTLIAIVLAFLVIYASRFLARRRNKEFAMYQLLGMTRGQIVSITAAETLIVGAASLIAGIVVGIGISQLLLMLTASMFEVEVPGFTFFISGAAVLRTVAVFAAIFAITILVTSRRVAMTPLIDLMKDGSRNEEIRLRSLPLSFVLFIVACALIGFSYELLIENGLMPSPKFFAATVLVCVGTVLFFYSLSGFLLKLLQMIKPLYFRGLNMFAVRQIAARANSGFVSMSVICMTLFFAMTSVCGGIGICTALQDSLDKTTAYDASVSTYWVEESGGMTEDAIGADENPSMAFAIEHDRSMAEGLAACTDSVGAPAFNEMVEESAQLDYRFGNLTFGDLDAVAPRPLISYSGEAVVAPGYTQQPLPVIALSQANAALELAGKDPITLADGRAMITGDNDITLGFLRDVCASEPVITLFGHELKVEPEPLVTTLETSGTPMQVGAIIVADDVIPEDAAWYRSVLNVRYDNGNKDAEAEFSTFASRLQASDNPDTWPINLYTTRQETLDASVSLSTAVSYLAIYIGLILVVACAAILAIQQLTAASDNRNRYELLSKIGASRAMIDGALFKQIAVAFLFPLVLGIAHTACAMVCVIDIVQVFGSVDIGAVSIIAAACFVAVYGLYFLVTYLTARSFIKPPKAHRS